MTLAIIAIILVVLTVAGGGITALNLHWKKTPFRPYIEKDAEKNQLTVKIHKREGAEWPAAAMHYRYEDDYERRYRHRPMNHAQIAVIDADEEDADEKLVAAIVKAKGFCESWRDGDDLDQLASRAVKLLKS